MTSTWELKPKSKVWRLESSAHKRWHATLATKAVQTDLLNATLRARPSDLTLPSGPLLLKHSARAPIPAAWRWDDKHGELALISHPSLAQACAGSGSLMLWDHTPDVAPGKIKQVQVFRSLRPGNIEVLPPGCIDAWQIEATPFASIDQTGKLALAANAPNGALIGLNAVIGEVRVRGTLRVLDFDRNPLVGVWQQVAAKTCNGFASQTPTDSIEELVFDGGGGFSVTRQPFEAYKDYWGKYEVDESSGSIGLITEGGNQIPEALVLKGRATVTGNTLTLENIVLWPAQGKSPMCNSVFTRTR